MSERTLVVKVLVEKDGKFLVVQKTENYGWKAGKWELPGGEVKDGENGFEAAERTVEEDTDLEVEDLHKVVRIEIDGDEHINCGIIHTRSFSGEVELSDEHQDYEWVRPEDFRIMDWHRDAGYALPAMRYLQEYLG